MSDINTLNEINELLIIANQFQFEQNSSSINIRAYLLFKKLSALYRKVNNFEIATYYTSKAETVLSQIEEGEYKNKLAQVVPDDFPVSLFLTAISNSTK